MSSNLLRGIDSIWKAYLNNDAVDSETPEDIKDDMELLNLLKGYLVQCAEKILDNPEELVKEVLKARDEEIKDLKKEIENLKKEIEELKGNSVPVVPYPLEPNPWTTTTAPYPWSSTFGPEIPLGNSGITYHASTDETKG